MDPKDLGIPTVIVSCDKDALSCSIGGLYGFACIVNVETTNDDGVDNDCGEKSKNPATMPECFMPSDDADTFDPVFISMAMAMTMTMAMHFCLVPVSCPSQ